MSASVNPTGSRFTAPSCEAALPVLEEAIGKSDRVWVRTACARELLQAGRPSGFAFAARAIAGKESYQLEIARFIRDQFPEVREADEETLLGFLRRRAGSVQ